MELSAPGDIALQEQEASEDRSAKRGKKNSAQNTYHSTTTSDQASTGTSSINTRDNMIWVLFYTIKSHILGVRGGELQQSSSIDLGGGGGGSGLHAGGGHDESSRPRRRSAGGAVYTTAGSSNSASGSGSGSGGGGGGVASAGQGDEALAVGLAAYKKELREHWYRFDDSPASVMVAEAVFISGESSRK